MTTTAKNHHMTLWTIQTEKAWEHLNERGYITGVINYIEQSWLSSYRWIADQMKERIGNPPCNTTFPIWAWYQWETSKRKRPDLRSAGHLPRNEKGVRIEFNCHAVEKRLRACLPFFIDSQTPGLVFFHSP